MTNSYLDDLDIKDVTQEFVEEYVASNFIETEEEKFLSKLVIGQPISITHVCEEGSNNTITCKLRNDLRSGLRRLVPAENLRRAWEFKHGPDPEAPKERSILLIMRPA